MKPLWAEELSTAIVDGRPNSSFSAFGSGVPVKALQLMYGPLALKGTGLPSRSNLLISGPCGKERGQST